METNVSGEPLFNYDDFRNPGDIPSIASAFDLHFLIGSRDWTVVPIQRREAENSDLWGTPDYENQEIGVADFICEQAQAGILVHEILHVLIDDAGLLLDADEEERIVSALAPRLAAFLEANLEEIREIVNLLGLQP